MTTADTRLWELVEAAALDITDEQTGRFENKPFIEEIRARLGDEDLAAHVRAIGIDRLAKSLADGFVRRRNPKPGKPSGMFHPRAVLPLGKGVRVWMEQATDSDLISWALQSTRNLTRVASAEGARQKYAMERIDAFRTHVGWRLGQIERVVFGYPDDDEPVNDPGDDDWDD